MFGSFLKKSKTHFQHFSVWYFIFKELVYIYIFWQLWVINSGQAQKKIATATYLNSLSYHGSAVNVLRFSPSGKNLLIVMLLFRFFILCLASNYCNLSNCCYWWSFLNRSNLICLSFAGELLASGADGMILSYWDYFSFRMKFYWSFIRWFSNVVLNSILCEQGESWLYGSYIPQKLVKHGKSSRISCKWFRHIWS